MTGLLVSAAVGAVAAQQVPPVAPQIVGRAAPAAFTIFLRGAPIGSEEISVGRSADGWTVTSSGRIEAPLDIVSREVRARYDPDWKPIELYIDGVVRGQTFDVRTAITSAGMTTRMNRGGQPATSTIATTPDLFLPESFFGPFEALAARLRTAEQGTQLTAYAPPDITFAILVGPSANQRFQTATQTIDARLTSVTFRTASEVPIDVSIWADRNGRLLRVSIPGQALDIVREDIARVSTRHVPVSRPNDEPVKIPSNGFSLAGTISRPATQAGAPFPAVVLVAGNGPADRDEYVFGVPVIGEIANALAESGFVTVRYDKRGVGQSGGRLESATFQDLADDALAAVRLLGSRKDVDPKRIAVLGHSEGGSVALLAAKDKRVAAAVLAATSGTKGSELILEQQRRLLAKMALTDEEKQARVDLQKRINDAVLTGRGWDKLPAQARRAADNSGFQSILSDDPARVMSDVRKPLLVVQGELDAQITPINADRLEALARKRKGDAPVTVVKLPGINHLLTPATTGDVEEYGTLTDRHVSPAAITAITGWLRSALTAK